MSKHHLVLLPGMDGTGHMFAPLLKALPPNFTATVVRYPHDQELTYEQLKPFAYRAISQSESFVLVAESFSGPLAIEMAATLTELTGQLQALILCASFASNPAPALLQWIRYLNAPFWFQFRLPHVFVRYAAALWDCDADVIDDLIEHTSTVLPNVLSHRFAQIMQVNVCAHLRRCPVPLLYLRASRDLLVPHKCWEEIARIKPDACFAQIDASHFLLQHRPVEAVAAIQPFLAANFGA